MTLSTFYVKANNGNLVEAKFLQYDGSYVVDPNLQTAINTPIYNQTGASISNANPGGYLIVPSTYSISSATQFATTVQNLMNLQITGPNGESITGLPAALTLMTSEFWPGGGQDLQRTYSGSTGTSGDFVSAFTDGTSYNLGVVSAYAGIPMSWSETGGGALNVLANSLWRTVPQDEMGDYSLTVNNSNSVGAGYALGQTLTGATSAEANPSSITLQGGSNDSFSTATIFQTSDDIQLDQNLKAGGSQSDSYQWSTNGSSTNTTNGYSGTNETGNNIYQQDSSASSSGVISVSISGQGDITNLTDATISFAAGTQASIDGVNNAVSLAANAAVSFASGATGNTATATGAGDSINISAAGGAVGPSVLTKVGTSEECSTTFDMAVVSNGVQATVVGTDGTDTINNNSANNGIQSTINWNAGGSEQQLYTNLGNGEASQFNNYSGASATGTDLNNILNMTNGTSSNQIYAGLPGNEQEQINYFSGFDDSGALNQTELNFTDHASQAQLYTGLPSGDKEIVDSYSGLNSSGALYKMAANDNQPQGALLLRRAS